MSSDCLFCRIIAGEIPAATLYEDDELLAFKDISPQAPQHFLLIPKKHISGPGAISPEDEALIGRLIRIGAGLAGKLGNGQCRLVMNNGAEAGQTVFHLHLHILGGRPMLWPPG